MLSIFAAALLIAARQTPLPRPAHERPFDRDADHAHRRFWLKYAASNR